MRNLLLVLSSVVMLMGLQRGAGGEPAPTPEAPAARTATYTYDAWPVWAPDSTRLAFCRASGGRFTGSAGNELWCTDLVRGTTQRLFPCTGFTSPSWSPDAKLLALVYDGSICIYDIERNVLSRVLPKGSTASDPVWAPDGKSLVYVSLVKDDWEITSAKVVAHEWSFSLRSPTVLATIPGSDDLPVCSPDGKWVAFQHQVDVGVMQDIVREVHVVSMDGKQHRSVLRLVDGSSVERLSWFPDSSRLLVCQNMSSLAVSVEISRAKPKGLPTREEFDAEMSRRMLSFGDAGMPYEEELKTIRRYGGYFQRLADQYVTYRYAFDSRGYPINDYVAKVVDIESGQTIPFRLPGASDDRHDRVRELVIAGDGKKLAYTKSRNHSGEQGTSIWSACNDGTEARDVSAIAGAMKDDEPFIVGLEPNFPFILSRPIGRSVELMATIGHTHAVDDITEVVISFLRPVDGSLFQVIYDRRADTARLAKEVRSNKRDGINGKEPNRELVRIPVGADTVANGIQLARDGEIFSAAGVHLARLRITLLPRDQDMAGFWEVTMGVYSEGKQTIQRMGWLLLTKGGTAMERR